MNLLTCLIDNKADVSISNNEGVSPLVTALYSGSDLDFIKHLIENKADILAKDLYNQSTLIQSCIQNIDDKNLSNWKVAKTLIDNKADINFVDSENKTALDYAIENKDLETINILLDNGATTELYDAVKIQKELEKERCNNITFQKAKSIINSRNFDVNNSNWAEFFLPKVDEKTKITTLSLLLEHLKEKLDILLFLKKEDS